MKKNILPLIFTLRSQEFFFFYTEALPFHSKVLFEWVHMVCW